MVSENLVIISGILLIVFVTGLFFYRKKTDKTDDEITLMFKVCSKYFIEYIENSDDAKEFNELSDYIIHVKNVIRAKLIEVVDEIEEIPTSAKKLLKSDSLDDIIEILIQDNMSILEETFVSVKAV